MMSEFNTQPQSYMGPRGWERRLCRFLFERMIRDPRIAIDFGDGVSQHKYDESIVVLAAPGLWCAAKILTAPGLFVGETFVSGEWYLRKGTLIDFIDIIFRHAPLTYGKYYDWTRRLRGVGHYTRQYLFNKRFSRQVRKHYEIDSKIYEMILDSEMVYTCGFFDEQCENLEEAQQNKLGLTLSRLHLPDDNPRILDIGCGWGAMERFVVKHHPTATICGLSISNGQIEWAKLHDRAVLSEPQRARVEYVMQDYISHEEFGRYSAVCAIGMIEHVGLGGYGEFFERAARFLKPDGYALIHTIVAPARGMPTNRWIDRHIFTGGYAPSISELLLVIESKSLRVEAIFLHGPANYRRTIEKWIDNLTNNASRMRTYLTKEGASTNDAQRALRTWYFYLSGVRNMFCDWDVHAYQVAQLCLKKL